MQCYQHHIQKQIKLRNVESAHSVTVHALALTFISLCRKAHRLQRRKKRICHRMSVSFLLHLLFEQSLFRRMFSNTPSRSRDSVVGIASSSLGKVKNFLFSTSSRPALGSTQPPVQCVPGVKRLGREADHSPPASAEVKNTWIYTSTHPYSFMA
jgi:hypothetical protein